MANPTTNFGWQMPTSSDLVTDLPADFEVFGQAVDTSLMDLKGGTTGQVLSKASNTDMDFTWVAQDDSNAIQNAIVDAKGDLIAATGADTPARLAVGTDGLVLTADSTAATGLKWAAAGAADNFTLINTGGTALTGASTITVSGISNKNKLFIRIENASSSSSGSQIRLRFNSDSGTNYGRIALANAGGSIDGSADRYNSLDHIVLARMGNVAGDFMDVFATVEGTNSTGVKILQSAGYGSGSGTYNQPVGISTYSGSSAISSVSVLTTAGNFDAGTIYIYGA